MHSSIYVDHHVSRKSPSFIVLDLLVTSHQSLVRLSIYAPSFEYTTNIIRVQGCHSNSLRAHRDLSQDRLTIIFQHG